MPSFIVLLPFSTVCFTENTKCLGIVRKLQLWCLIYSFFDLTLYYLLTVVSCGDPGSVQFTTKSGSSFVYNEFVEYQCVEGYLHSGGNLSRTCQSDESFSGTAPICTGK